MTRTFSGTWASWLGLLLQSVLALAVQGQKVPVIEKRITTTPVSDLKLITWKPRAHRPLPQDQ